MPDWSEADIPDLSGKQALVTGGATGIGYETSRALAQHGAQVIIASRREEAGNTAVESIRALSPQAQVEYRRLDLSSLADVRAFSAMLAAEGGQLDILVNNAGLQPINTRRETDDGFELCFGVGHLGHFALTAGVWPLIKAAPDARVVTVSSFIHGQGRFDWNDLQLTQDYDSQKAYNQTKLANLLFALELQRRIDASGGNAKSMASHPGAVPTTILSSRKQLGKLDFGDRVISLLAGLVMRLFGQPASAGALSLLYAATAPEARGGSLYGPQGFGQMRGPPGPAKIKPAGQDLEAARKLWEAGEDLTGIRLAP